MPGVPGFLVVLGLSCCFVLVLFVLVWQGRGAGNLSDLSLEVSFLTPGLSLLSHEPVYFGERKITGRED